MGVLSPIGPSNACNTQLLKCFRQQFASEKALKGRCHKTPRQRFSSPCHSIAGAIDIAVFFLICHSSLGLEQQDSNDYDSLASPRPSYLHRMSNAHEDVADFTKSKAQAQEYPLNLVRAQDFPYILGNYRSTLDSEETKLFSTKQNLIVFWDLIASQDSMWP